RTTRGVSVLSWLSVPGRLGVRTVPTARDDREAAGGQRLGLDGPLDPGGQRLLRDERQQHGGEQAQRGDPQEDRGQGVRVRGDHQVVQRIRQGGDRRRGQGLRAAHL